MADWSRIGSRGDVSDRRGIRSAAVGGLSVGGLALMLLVNYLGGGNITDVLQQLPQMAIERPAVQGDMDTSQFEGDDTYEVFASTVLGSNNDLWEKQFAKINRDYTDPKLVLFRDYTESECGGADSRVGPHYCPYDQTVYLDETFFNQLTEDFGAKGGDVAEAYVIAHEVGHHVQNQLGVLDQVESNEDQIQVELQADCLAGMWANSIRGLGVMEAGEISEAMDAAAAVGDDRIQKKVTGYVNPETWTHGSSQERLAAFNRGFEAGLLSTCVK